MILRAALLLGLLTSFAALAADKPGKHVNRLAKESSPYLRQHAHNPVNWFPWGAEAFDKAKKENKLVFLSIGYSSCHWCHVMERESFAGDDVAKVLNDHFVCIKVDREERPDIDEIYMNALHVLGQSGGWPLSMFLTPEGDPIIGGTYWPKEDREVMGEKVNGFKSILNIMIGVKAKQPKEMAEQAKKIAEATREKLGQLSRAKVLTEVSRKLIDAGVEEVGGGFDEQHGGFGRKARGFRGPKFPMPSYLELILAELKRGKSDDLHRQLTVTLEKMAKGGIFDHLGGGFHRYSTERTWTVPHFEKMLYDNAQLVELYSKAHENDPRPDYERAVRETLEFIKREMTSPEGGFYSALDADSEGEEGKFYVWSPKELEAALPDRAQLALTREAFAVGDGLNFEQKASILTRNADMGAVAKKLNLSPEELAAKQAAAARKLLELRAKRERPFLDTKILTAWNGQMIAGYAAAGRVFKNKEYVAAAAKAADFILATMRTKDGRLLRSYIKDSEARLNAYLDDYAFLTHGLIALHEATGTQRWLDEAKSLTETMVKWHRDEKNGGYYYTSHDHEKLFARSKDQHDGAQPCGNSVAARNLVRLAKLTGDAKYRELAKSSFESFAGTLQENPSALSTMLVALGEYLEVTAEAKPDDLKKPDRKPNKSDSKVKVSAVAEKPDAGGKQVVSVTLEIDTGWYTYANPVGNKDFEGGETTLKVAGKGNPKVLGIEYAKGQAKKSKLPDGEIEYLIYEGKVTFKATVQRMANDAEPLDVTVKYGACSHMGVCLLPTATTVSVK